MDENNQNLDVWDMQEQLAAQAAGSQYDNSQAALTSARSSYGDIPAMMMTGAGYAGGAISGAYRGAGNMLSSIGSTIRPATYMPPARVVTGQYGQYQQKTGFFSGLTGMLGYNSAPIGTNAYTYGYNNAADFGERVGAGLSSAMMVGAGAFAGTPIGGAIGGAIGGIAGAAFGPIGSAVGSAVGNVAGSIAGYMGFDALGESVAQRREMNSFLESSSFRYVGSGNAMYDPRTGGMNTGSRKNVTDTMRRMDIADPTMDTADLFKTLQGATQMGMFSGTNDIEGFKKRFKDIVDGVKSMTRVLGTSLEEGLQVMKDLRAINIDPSAARQTVMQADAIGKMTGRTGQEVVGLGLQGAELFRGTGIETKIGYQSNVMNLASLRASRDAGMLSQEAIVQAGGEESLAQRMTAGGLGFVQSANGRGFGAAFYNPAAGPAGFDRAGFMQNAMNGGMGMEALAMRAAQNMSDPSKVLGYQANQAKYMSELGKTFGGMGNNIALLNESMANARMLYSSGATENMQDAFRVSLQERGQSEAQIETFLAMAKNNKGAFRGQIEGLATTRAQQAITGMAETSGLDYMGRRAADTVRSAFEPFTSNVSAAIEGTRQGAIGVWERKGLGIHRVSTGDADYSAMRGMYEGGDPVGAAKTNLDESRYFSLAPTMGKLIGNIVPQLNAFGLGGTTEKNRADVLPGEVIISDPIMGKVTVVDGKKLHAAQNANAITGMTATQARQMEEEGRVAKSTPGQRLKMSSIVGGGAKNVDLNEISMGVLGIPISKASPEQYASLVNTAEDLAKSNDATASKIFTKAREGTQGVSGVDETASVQAIEMAQANIDAASKKIVSSSQGVGGKYYKGEMSRSTMMLLAQAQGEGNAAKKQELLQLAAEAQSKDTRQGAMRFAGGTAAGVGILGSMLEDKGTAEIIRGAGREGAKIAALSERVGMNELIGMARADILADKTLKAGESVKIMEDLDKASTFSGFMEMDKGSPLFKTTAGATLQKGRDIAKILEGLDTDLRKEKDPEKVGKIIKEKLSGRVGSEESMAKIVDAQAKGGLRAAQQEVFAQTTEQLAPKNLVGGAGAAGMGSGNEQGTPAEIMAVQLNMFKNIQMALEGTAQRLGK